MQNESKPLWFKRKMYGWGWTPSTWQGWLVTLIHVALIFVFVLTLDDTSTPQDVAFTFILPVILLITSLITICYKKGEKPRWQWGRNEDEK
jgi:hypothetical protein